MTVTVADMLKIMEVIAPSRLAENWDNSGLQVGRKDWEVQKIRVALDPLPDVVAEACRENISLLITHHPLLFKPLKKIDLGTPVGNIIGTALAHRMSIFSAHTNLDSVRGGVNDVLAARIGLSNLSVLADEIRPEACKLVVYVPAEDEHELLDALFETPAGKIGSYDCCSFRNRGMGTFRPGETANPFTGERGEISHADEIRIEAVVQKEDLRTVIRHIRRSHPYETMAYDVYPLFDASSDANGSEGIGRVGTLDKPVTLENLARHIQQALGLDNLRFSGNPDLKVEKIALCSGSGSSLMKNFMASGAEVYVSGDLRYHDARDVEATGRGLVDIGHFASEHLMLDVLAERLRTVLADNGLEDAVEVDTCGLEKDPFIHLRANG